MASVTLQYGYFHPTSDKTDELEIKVNSVTSTEAQSNASVRQSLTGRRRLITRPGLGNTYQINLVLVNIANDLAWLRTHTNQELLFRDPRGRKAYGFIDALSLQETPGPTDATRGVSFTFSDITKTDAV